MGVVVILITLALMTGQLLLAGLRVMRHPSAQARWAGWMALGGAATLLSSVLMIAILPAPVQVLLVLEVVGQIGALLLLPSLYFHLRLRNGLQIPRALLWATAVAALVCLATHNTFYDSRDLAYIATRKLSDLEQDNWAAAPPEPTGPIVLVNDIVSTAYALVFALLAGWQALRLWPWRRWWRYRLLWMLIALLLLDQAMTHWLGDKNNPSLWLQMALMLWLAWEVGTYVLRIGSAEPPQAQLATLPAAGAAQAPDPAPKYDRSPLTPAAAQALAERLQAYLDTSQAYRQPGLSLDDLATALGVTPHALSQAMNQHLQLNFYELVNQYRVQAACQQLADPAQRELSLLAIAFEAGFQSKSTFNSAFKKYVGVTPSAYREQALAQADATNAA